MKPTWENANASSRRRDSDALPCPCWGGASLSSYPEGLSRLAQGCERRASYPGNDGREWINSEGVASRLARPLTGHAECMTRGYMVLIRTLFLLLLVTLPAASEELRLLAMKLRLDYPGRNQPRETRWVSSVDPKYSKGDTNVAAKARDVVLMKEGKGKTFAISVSDRRGNENLFGTNGPALKKRRVRTRH